MKFWHIMLIVGFMTVMDFMIVGAILHLAVQTLFEPLSKRFPPKQMREDAVEKSFQSMKVGMMNFGMSVHVGVDDQHVHIVPAKIFRWCGAKASSVPMSEVSVKATSVDAAGCRANKLIEGVIGGIGLRAPAWVFQEVEKHKTSVAQSN